MTDERSLVFRVINGDAPAFRQLIKQHERLVMHMISRVIKNDAEREELCQDVFLKVFDKLTDFNFQSKLSTWIATIAYRFAINAGRKHKLNLTDYEDGDLVNRQFIDEKTPETIYSENDLNQYVLNLIEKLPAQYKIVLTLYHVEGMHYSEISKVTGMPEGTVKNYLFRARYMLKEKVKAVSFKEDLL